MPLFAYSKKHRDKKQNGLTPLLMETSNLIYAKELCSFFTNSMSNLGYSLI